MDEKKALKCRELIEQALLEAGPMTGGAGGLCYPATVGYYPGYVRKGSSGLGLKRVFRGGFGPGTGRWYGRGLGRRGVYHDRRGCYGPASGSPDTIDPTDELNMLKADAEAVKNELDAINKHIEDLWRSDLRKNLKTGPASKYSILKN